MFSKSYIEKCIKHRSEIDSLVLIQRGQFQTIQPPIPRFREGDYFNHPKMGKGLFGRIAKVAQTSVYAENQSNLSYKEDECILIPTENQLYEIIEANNFSIDDSQKGKGPEALLDWYISERYEATIKLGARGRAAG
ncbi:MAG: hypothetical protein MUQ00_02390 [Candidatus Aminicenantes bacterium]|nr:hypothetical protein [Candidatus Aminicenantes bacterium]